MASDDLMHASKPCKRGLLSRLRTDTSGNALAIMAAALIPMSALVGSAVDMSRLYVVKVRLQQACDAGVLAGRKFMDETNATSTLDSNAAAKAQDFFRNNMNAGWFETNSVSFTPVKTDDSQVSGTATATVPMTVMKMFAQEPTTLNVACEARFDVADADIMFVLDVTGSMACAAADASCSQAVVSHIRPDGSTGWNVTEKANAKMIALRAAVLQFYDTLANNADASTNIRYGIVPYTSSINVGYDIPAAHMITDTWDYQSRRIVGDANNGAATSTTSTATTSATCTAWAGRTPASGYETNGTAIVRTVAWTSASGGTCTRTTQNVRANWRYGPWTTDISDYVAGNTVADPSKLPGATSRWQGCIEERDTTTATTFNQASLPPDLDPDLAPTSRATRWRPMWPDIIYRRNTSVPAVDNADQAAPTTNNYANVGVANTTSYSLQAGYVSCGKRVQRLAKLTRAQVNAYLTATDFRPQGGTYHDVGMIWGARLISPNGIFAADTAAWPNRNPPNRHLVFMTDGAMAPNQDIYGQYGVERYDRRVTGGSSSPDLTARHTARFLAACSAAKARGITVWLVGFGAAGSLSTETKTCASPGKAYDAATDAQLQTAFTEIATQIAELRLSK